MRRTVCSKMFHFIGNGVLVHDRSLRDENKQEKLPARAASHRVLCGRTAVRWLPPQA